MTSVSFGDGNVGLQIGTNNAPVNAQFHLPTRFDDSSKEVDNIRNKILLTDPILDRETIRSTKGHRAIGTCEWIRDNELYTSYLDGETECIWMCGGPGKGKTMLSIFLTEEIEKYNLETDDMQLIFHICSYQDDKRNSAVAILRSFIYQMLTRTPQLFNHISHYFTDDKKVDMILSNPQVLWTIFALLLQVTAGTVYCVLDGLDECDDESVRFVIQNVKLHFSSGGANGSNVKFRLIILSRNVSGLEIFPQINLELNDQNTNSDIRRFISEKVSQFQNIPGFQEIQAHVQETLSKKADGTFLWVGFVTAELSRKTTCTDILDTLSEMPSGLPALYTRMLARTQPSRRPILSRLLRWAGMAIRPLHLMELAEAMSIQPTEYLSREQAMLDYIAMCGDIIQMHHKRITLVHQSAKDYLHQEKFDDPRLQTFHIQPDIAHSQIAGACIDYIESCYMRQSSVGRRIESEFLSFPLLAYAILQWPEHAKLASSNPEHGLNFSRSFFHERSEVRRHWWLACHWYPHSVSYNSRPEFKNRDFGLNNLHIASYFGIELWVREVISKKGFQLKFPKPIDKMDIMKVTPLRYAVQSQSKGIVALLIENGAKMGGKRDALGDAAEVGNEAILKLLLERGAHSKHDLSGALTKACRHGQERIVEILLKWGASDDSGSLDIPAELHAARNGHFRRGMSKIPPPWGRPSHPCDWP